MPPLPPPAGLHPLVVHFPVALLTVVPLFLLGGLLLPRFRPALAASALILMVLGTVAAYVAVETGAETEHAVEMTRAQQGAVHEHEELAETTRTTFTVLTLAFGALVLLGRRAKPGLQTAAHGIFLAAYLAGWIVLANTAHHGGLVVHGYGVRAPVAGMPADAPAAPADTVPDDDHEEHDEDHGNP